MNEYVTVDELRYTLELPSAFADLNVAQACEAASRAVDDHTGRRFYTTTSDEIRYFSPDQWYQVRYVDGDPVGYWTSPYLDVGDLSTVTGISVDTNDDGTYEQAWVQDTDYRLEPYNAPLDGWPYERLVLRSIAGRTFPGYDHSIRVTGKFGWSATPAAIKMATSMLASRWLKRMREAPFGAVGIGPDGGVVTISAVDVDVLALLRPYSRHSVLT